MQRQLLSLACLAAFGAAAQGCAVGQFLADRGRDLADCVRLQAGFGPGIGINVRAAGTVQVGLVVASVPRVASIGWDYGRPSGVLAPRETWALVDPDRLSAARTLWDGEVSASAIGWLTAVVLTVAAPLAATGGGVGGVGAVGAGGFGGLSLPSRNQVLAFLGYWETAGAPGPSVSRAYETRTGTMVFDGVFGRVRADDRGLRGPGPNVPLWSGRALAATRRVHRHAFDCEASVYAGFVYAKAGFSLGEFLDFVGGWVGLDVFGDDGR